MYKHESHDRNYRNHFMLERRGRPLSKACANARNGEPILPEHLPFAVSEQGTASRAGFEHMDNDCMIDDAE